MVRGLMLHFDAANPGIAVNRNALEATRLLINYATTPAMSHTIIAGQLHYHFAVYGNPLRLYAFNGPAAQTCMHDCAWRLVSEW